MKMKMKIGGITQTQTTLIIIVLAIATTTTTTATAQTTTTTSPATTTGGEEEGMTFTDLENYGHSTGFSIYVPGGDWVIDSFFSA